MKAGKAVALAIALVAVLVAAVFFVPAIHDRWASREAPVASAPAPAAAPETSTPAVAERRNARVKTPSRADDVVAAKKRADTISTIPVAVWEPELRDRVKAVLSPGARLDVAAADFDDTEQFVTVAHAARNTNVPFMVLKDGLLNRGRSLAEAIHEYKPELDAKAEVKRARAAARADLRDDG